MHRWQWLTIVLLGLAAWITAIRLNRRRVRLCENSGDPNIGILVFVEPVRWLFIIWGFALVCRGLRRAGCEHQVRLFRWSGRAGSLLVLPDLMRRGRLLTKARRPANHLENLRSQCPHSTIYLCGYSTGCYVALEAVRRAPRQIGTVVLLAGTASPGYELTGIGNGNIPIYNFHSSLDFLINGTGPLLFGSNDRRWGPACGMVGFASPPAQVVQRAWSLRDIGLGYFGDHFTIVASPFVARHVAPLLAEK